jgi:hypothetical protein
MKIKVKVNVKLPLFLTKSHAMKAYGGVELEFHASGPGESPNIHWI